MNNTQTITKLQPSISPQQKYSTMLTKHKLAYNLTQGGLDIN